MRALLACGATVDIRDERGITPLMMLFKHPAAYPDGSDAEATAIISEAVDTDVEGCGHQAHVDCDKRRKVLHERLGAHVVIELLDVVVQVEVERVARADRKAPAA